jgi:hypothetical protein
MSGKVTLCPDVLNFNKMYYLLYKCKILKLLSAAVKLHILSLIQSTSVIPASVIMDFGYNGSFFHSPAVSLCFIIVTTLVTPACYISDLQSHRISPTFPNS